MLTAAPSPDEAFSETLRMGRGSILHAEWHPDGQRFLVDTVRGAWLYSVDETSGRFVNEAHIETARTARFSPDGSLIAGINEDQAVTLWNATTYTPITTLSAHNAFVRSLAWHPIENLLATLDQTGRIIAWDSANSEQSRELYLEGADQIAWSPSGAYLSAVDRERGAVNVWDATGELVFAIPPGANNPYGVDVIWRNENQLLLRIHDAEIPHGVLWDIDMGNSTEIPRIGYANAYNPDGTRFALSAVGSAGILDAETGDILFTIDGPRAIVVRWSSDGDTVAFGDWTTSVVDKARVTVVEAKTGEITQTLDFDFSIKGIYWRPNSQAFVVIDESNQIFLSGSRTASSMAHTEIGSVAAWRPDGQAIAVSDRNYGARLWDARIGMVLIPRMNSGHPATQLSWQPGGDLLATAVGDFWQSVHNNVYVWDTSTPASSAIDSLYTIPHVNRVTGLAWHPDGTTLASMERQQYIRLWQPDDPGTINVIDTRAIRMAPFVDHTQMYNAFGWSTDGDTLHAAFSSSGNWGGVQLIDVDEPVLVFGDTPPNFASTWIWTPDGRFIWAKWGQYGNVPPVQDISIGGEGITDDEQPPLLLTGLMAQVEKGIFSPDASSFIGFDAEDNAMIWDVATQTHLASFRGFHDAVWSPDSMMLALYSTDGFVHIVNPQDGEVIHVFDQHYQETGRTWTERLQVVWSPDSSRIALLDQGVLFIYDRID